MSVVEAEEGDGGTGDGPSGVEAGVTDLASPTGRDLRSDSRAPDPPARDAGPEDGTAVPLRARPAVRVLLRMALGLALIALLGGTVAARVELGDRRADASEAAVAEARLAEARRDAALVADAVVAQLAPATLAGEAAADARAAQGVRLAELGLTETEMEDALDDAQAGTAAVELQRDELAAQVDRQALEDLELQACVVEVRRALDAAFHAANRSGVDVPATREICRALAAARGAS